MKRIRENNLVPLIYAAMIPSLQARAREMGYALAIHGSMRADFDLVAIPWAEVVSTPKMLVDAIAELSAFSTAVALDGPEQKPHGRQAWSIALSAGLRIDISVMPTRASDRLDF